MKETEKIHEFKTATRHLREWTRFPLLLKQPENMQGCGQRLLNVRKKQKKKPCPSWRKIKSKENQQIWYSLSHVIKHYQTRQGSAKMISCASRALRSASTRSLKTFGLFFWQLHHGVRFWRRFHSKRRLDLDLFIMDECLLKEWSLVIACGGRGYQRILVVSG